MKTLDQIFKNNNQPKSYSKGYVDFLIALLNRLDHHKVAQIIEALDYVYQQRGRVYLAGNGGSASTCGHIVNDFHAGSIRHGGGGFRMIDLTSNVASLTALANDVGYDDVFAKQIERVVDPHDMVIVISASGNSKNLLKVVEYAKSQGAKTVGFLGFDGGALKAMCDMALVIETEHGQYGPVEDVHLILNHLISTYFTFKRNAHGS